MTDSREEEEEEDQTNVKKVSEKQKFRQSRENSNELILIINRNNVVQHSARNLIARRGTQTP